jgi:hypothetical protein
MDQSEARRLVEAHIEGYTAALGIAFWRLTILYEPIDAEPGRVCRDHKAAGECITNVRYNRATIRLDPAQLDDAAKLLEALRHELFHVVLAPFLLYRDHYLATVERGSGADDQESRLWEFVAEQAVINLERVWEGIAERNTLRVAEEAEMVRKSKKELPAEFVKHMGHMNGDKPKTPKAAPKGKAASKKKGA